MGVEPGKEDVKLGTQGGRDTKTLQLGGEGRARSTERHECMNIAKTDNLQITNHR